MDPWLNEKAMLLSCVRWRTIQAHAEKVPSNGRRALGLKFEGKASTMKPQTLRTITHELEALNPEASTPKEP